MMRPTRIARVLLRFWSENAKMRKWYLRENEMFCFGMMEAAASRVSFSRKMQYI
jgi:hypothetical protein